MSEFWHSFSASDVNKTAFKSLWEKEREANLRGADIHSMNENLRFESVPGGEGT